MPKLTKRTVESAKAREKDYFIWDNELPGLGLRVYTSSPNISQNECIGP